jgi:hypothetical protein
MTSAETRRLSQHFETLTLNNGRIVIKGVLSAPRSAPRTDHSQIIFLQTASTPLGDTTITIDSEVSLSRWQGEDLFSVDMFVQFPGQERSIALVQQDKVPLEQLERAWPECLEQTVTLAHERGY